MLNEKKTYNVHRIYLFIKKIALYSPFNMFISYLWLLTELNTFAVISYIEVRLLMLVHSEKKKKGGGEGDVFLFQGRFCRHQKELAEFICMVQRYALLTNIRQNNRCEENYFTGRDMRSDMRRGNSSLSLLKCTLPLPGTWIFLEKKTRF